MTFEVGDTVVMSGDSEYTYTTPGAIGIVRHVEDGYDVDGDEDLYITFVRPTLEGFRCRHDIQGEQFYTDDAVTRIDNTFWVNSSYVRRPTSQELQTWHTQISAIYYELHMPTPKPKTIKDAVCLKVQQMKQARKELGYAF